MKTIKIGADPEFCFKRNGEIVMADEVIGYDDETELGTDASADTAEIRPKAGNYWQVARRISRLLGEAAALGYDGFAGSGDVIPLGGHIHISGIEFNAELQSKLLRFITSPLNSVSNTRLRRHEGYGRIRAKYVHNSRDLDIVRYNDHGWEYRSPASWLSTPILTKGVLAISWVLARATSKSDLHKINTKNELINYATKAEAVHIRLFYDAIKSYKTNNVKLEQIEMFAAWGKTKTNTKTLMALRFQHDDYFGTIQLKLKKVRCCRPLYFYGVGGYDKSVATCFGQGKEAVKAKIEETLNKLDIRVDNNYYGQKWRIGLSRTLRRDTDLTVLTIKHIITIINEFEGKKCAV
jgi:hypothetical protein